ncbi:YHYH domain-containing protein [Paenibacillus eucommiae]|uniref:YHYH domain-containing protein n=1 Tax=Paenibacillus eucommiae TaxID=1355755 RepID=A0ABS4IYS1_9BACL|nr:YHYH domain-containing protein [Paenibacillus eucommiae]MBP1992739.1 hypothetical protein [Paenibacillus eucommiae]
MKWKVLCSALALVFLFAAVASAHPGRTDANGGHTCRTNCEKWGLEYGEYHYHNGGTSSKSSGSKSSSSKGSTSGGSSSSTSKAPASKPKQEKVNPLQASLPTYKITINDTEVDNAYAKYPVLQYKNITYFPMTWEYTQALGIKVDWKKETGFSIAKTDAKASNFTQQKDSYNSSSANYIFKYPAYNVTINGSWLDNYNEEYPVMVYKEITYFPMTWKFAVDELGLTINYDSAQGLA